ncbi:MAG: bile acid:sodium symporter family protein [Spirochaetaceae bacterium]|nr:bile acid:sodium symporter family protein [Spirochaetaceae bacterium]
MDHQKKPAEWANALNRRLEGLMPILTPAGILLGFSLPRVFITLQPLIPLLFGLMTLSGALKLRARDLGFALRDPLPVLLFFIISHGLLPVLVFFGGRLVFDDPDIMTGFVLLFSVPTAVSGFIWISIFRGNTALSLALILLDTLAAPLLVPGTVSLLLGTRVAPDMSGIAVSLLFMVVFPTVLGVGLNEASRERLPRLVSPFLGPLSKFCLVLVISANAAAAAPQVNPGDPRLWIIALLCILFAFAGFAGAKCACRLCRLSPDKGVTLFFAVGLRNISAAATLAIEFFPEAAALPAILGIVFQQAMSALMGRIFLPKPKDDR